MPTDRKQIKFRLDRSFERRLEWAMYCEQLATQQDLMAALELWLNFAEEKWGPPVEPRRHWRSSTEMAAGNISSNCREISAETTNTGELRLAEFAIFRTEPVSLASVGP